MLADFQQALADFTPSPALCSRVRQDPAALNQDYRLTARDRYWLLGIVRHAGMACACTVYRANRLASLALNMPPTCKALGTSLRDVVEAFWATFPETNVHFFVETDRFCRFLQAQLAEGCQHPPEVIASPAIESEAVAAELRESRLES